MVLDWPVSMSFIIIIIIINVNVRTSLRAP
jgi:hypothetical protein